MRAAALVRTDLDTCTDTCTLLGWAVFQAQRLEFALYGLAAHCTHLPEAKQDRRFAALTPADFSSPDPAKRALRRATLGQIVALFGDRFMLPPSEIEDLVERRNLIVHEFYRVVEYQDGSAVIPDPKQFLTHDATLLTYRGVNAMAESVVGLFKAEVIHRRGPWRGFDDVEYATLEWVAWFNT